MSIQPNHAGIRGIVFDLDGTLVDSNLDITRALNEMLREHHKGPIEPSQVAPLLSEGAFRLVAGVHRIVGLPASDPEVRRNTERYLELYRREPVRDSTLFADAALALQQLWQRGVRLGVCTNKEQQLALQVLDGLGVLAYFTAVVGGDQLPVRKPDPEHLLATVRMLGLTPEQTIYIGDSPVDVECAQRAGVRCGVVDWTAFKIPDEPLPQPAQDARDGLASRPGGSPSFRLRCFMDLVPLTTGTPPELAPMSHAATSTDPAPVSGATAHSDPTAKEER